jgi:hypothetical protein
LAPLTGYQLLVLSSGLDVSCPLPKAKVVKLKEPELVKNTVGRLGRRCDTFVTTFFQIKVFLLPVYTTHKTTTTKKGRQCCCSQKGRSIWDVIVMFGIAFILIATGVVFMKMKLDIQS